MTWIPIILDVPLLTTKLVWCHFRGLTVTYCSCSALSQVSHCHLLGLLCIVSVITFSLIEMAFIILGIFLLLIQVCHYLSLGWLFVILKISRMLTWVTLCCTKCPTAAHWGGSAISGNWVPIFGKALHHFRCLTAVFLNGFVLFQVSYNCSQSWLCVISDVPLHLTEMAWCYSCCSTAIHWGDIASTQVSHCRSVTWLHIIPDVQLPLTWITASSQVSHSGSRRLVHVFHWY